MIHPLNPAMAATDPPPGMEARRWLVGVDFPPHRPLINISQAAPVDLPPLALRQAIADGDAAQVEYLAHTLKGSSRMLGAKAMAEVCLELEAAGRKQQLQDSDRLSAQLEHLLPSVVTYLEAYVAK